MPDPVTVNPPDSLHVAHYGTGPDLVLLHGWGMHSGVWETTVEALMDDWRITVIDLPGHGASRGRLGTLPELAARIAAHAPRHAVWCGWSLGGMVAQRIALDRPEAVRRLLLVGSNACFVQRPDWPHGMTRAAYEAFASGLGSNLKATLDRFLLLETHGLPKAREYLHELRAIVFRHGLPDAQALADGLQMLDSEDLRSEWPRLRCPVRLLLGRRDALVPYTAGAALAARAGDVRVHVFAHATHAPFMSHPEEFLAALRVALHD
ncbi:pimeloyl-ACP methyl ester esterase BioH [Plasticicumulans acidivorans]|uniref:Pimeloyl-[acyl-carrier protein] methyl ester esterase n=1 Tax=Plasticicumulans acidivorans TaxID=886464 RepID=A0A317MVW8_9GAMM|nr:pimeloyl-ACP methyl ester esterase BioH [Plasticicumulans acidivorans]PWV61785.1 carboxylesterase BioH (pimeloyl-CoA synthesis) [Plasticicumulans acidivorans]